MKTNSFKVAIRVDVSPKIGTGHITRCCIIAEELRNMGSEVIFICREQSDYPIYLLKEFPFPIITLPEHKSSIITNESYLSWLGVTQYVDASETLNILKGQHINLLIIDHYGIDHTWEKQLRPYVDHIFVIDDLANRAHECDVLLDQNEHIEAELRYKGLVPSECQLLVGARYALLHPEYAKYRQLQNLHTGIVKRVLVFFGGTDFYNMTGKILSMLSSPEFEKLEVDIVVGATNIHRTSLEQIVSKRTRTTIHYSRPHLADLMAQSDLAIGAGGITTWERCCLGLPTLVVSLAKNQVSACQELHHKGIIVYLGDVESIDFVKLNNMLPLILKDKEKLISMSKNGQILVDGTGTNRVAHFLYSVLLKNN